MYMRNNAGQSLTLETMFIELSNGHTADISPHILETALKRIFFMQKKAGEYICYWLTYNNEETVLYFELEQICYQEENMTNLAEVL